MGGAHRVGDEADVGVVASRLVLPRWCGGGQSLSAAVVSGARRHSDWQLKDVCGTSTFNEVARSWELRCARLDLSRWSRLGER